MVTSTDAGGPAATIRSIRSGISTLRPAESTTSRPAMAGNDQVRASSAMNQNRKPGASRARLGAHASLAHQLAHGAEFLLGRGACDALDRPVERDDLLAHRRKNGTAALAAAGRGRD